MKDMNCVETEQEDRFIFDIFDFTWPIDRLRQCWSVDIIVVMVDLIL